MVFDPRGSLHSLIRYDPKQSIRKWMIPFATCFLLVHYFTRQLPNSFTCHYPQQSASNHWSPFSSHQVIIAVLPDMPSMKPIIKANLPFALALCQSCQPLNVVGTHIHWSSSPFHLAEFFISIKVTFSEYLQPNLSSLHPGITPTDLKRLSILPPIKKFFLKSRRKLKIREYLKFR